MKLKLVVASMSVLGLVSCPVFAATHSTHKHHSKHQMRQTTANHDYKDMGALPYKDQPVACMVGQNALMMADMTQNIGRAMPNPCNPGWFNRLAFSGGLNFDFGKFGNRNGNFMGENYQRASLNDAYLNLSADVNEWAKVFASLSAGTASANATQRANGNGSGTINAEYSSAYSNNIGVNARNSLQLEQAYATFADADSTPFFVQTGKYFQDFGRYEIHPITRSLTQSMSETLATALGVGFLTNGFTGQVFAFDNPITLVGKTSTTTNFGVGNTTNYGAALGYNQVNSDLGWDLGAGYLYNMMGVNDIAYAVNQQTAGGYNNRVGGTAVYGDVNSGPFTLGARYTSALQRFSNSDLDKQSGSSTGAEPWAAGLQAGYGFDAFGKNNNVYVGYQASREAVFLGLPKQRWLAGYGIDVFGKNTNVGVEWDHDIAYTSGNGGSGNSYNLVSLRSSVKFG